jgi:hypothetical protein
MRKTLFLVLLLCPLFSFAGYFGIGFNFGGGLNHLRNLGNETITTTEYTSHVAAPNNSVVLSPLNLSYKTKHLYFGAQAQYFSKNITASVYVNHILFSEKKFSLYYGLSAGYAHIRLSTVPLRISYKTTCDGLFGGAQIGLLAKANRFSDIYLEGGFRYSQLNADLFLYSEDQNSAHYSSIPTRYRYMAGYLVFGINFKLFSINKKTISTSKPQ